MLAARRAKASLQLALRSLDEIAQGGRVAWQFGRLAATAGPADDGADVTADRAARVVKHAFNKAPEATAAAILRECSELDRVHLILALKKTVKEDIKVRESTAYVSDLVKDIHPDSPHKRLTKAEIASAVEYQRSLKKLLPVTTTAPAMRQLLAIAVASGLPFVGFGLVDNAVMLLAGEQIDAAFGASLGLTTLASAALGNLVADVVGVSVTHEIQSLVRKVMDPPRLSKPQQALRPVKYAQLLGAVVGVSVGCLLGMSPLAIMPPGFFDPERAAAAAAAAAEAIS